MCVCVLVWESAEVWFQRGLEREQGGDGELS
jgi:hypothetical protein